MLRAIQDYLRQCWQESLLGWNRFWFTPMAADTLAIIRILAGGMLLYTHAVWSLDLDGFFGARGWLSVEFMKGFHGTPAAWTIFPWIESTTMLWSIHGVALITFFLLMMGCFTRVTSVLSFLLASCYAHRAVGALFGLDQINLMLAMYLLLGDAGAAYSIDAWRRKRAGEGSAPRLSVWTNIAIRLMQLHLCVIYFFAAIAKLQGESWWDGMAMWLALANYEYQSVDVTFLGQHPYLINVLTHVSVLWELSYSALIWPRQTRPWMLALAVPLHGGIAICMGMKTFGFIMLVANLAFVPPEMMRRAVTSLTGTGRPPGHARRLRASRV